MKNSSLILSFIVALLVSGCDGGAQEEVVTISTSYGDMVAVLYDETPKHKENFLKLIDQKYFDSTLFHRVMEGFMIQGGDPDSKNAAPGQQLGQGGPGYTIPAEFNPKLYHEKGALAAARLGDQQNPEKESSGSQFYIVQGTLIPEDQQKIDQQKLQRGLQQMYQTGQYKPFFDSLEIIYNMGDMNAYQAEITKNVARIEKATGTPLTIDVPADKLKAYSTIGGVPFLDNNYTVFGKVIKGLEVIDKITAVQKDYANRPLEDIRMTVTHKKMSRSAIKKDFDYTFPSK